MKDMLRILTKVLYSQYFFSFFTAMFILKLHLILSSRVLLGNMKIELLTIYDFSNNIYLWRTLQLTYILVSFCGCYIISLCLYNTLLKPFENKEKLFKTKPESKPKIKDKLNLLVGINKGNQKWVSINEKGLYQNILITGTIGTGKTTSALYPFTKQLMKYKNNDENLKTAMLILDVKGNYYSQVLKFAKETNRRQDINIIEINGDIKYNPLHKPDLKPIVLANRIKTILTLFSEQGMSDSYWLDKAENIIAEIIKFCRIYNNGYVTFDEIHKVITDNKYLQSKINNCKNKFILGEIKKEQISDLETCIEFFQNEYKNLDYRTSSIIKSEITRITQVFVSDSDIKAVFCSREESLNFKGFKNFIDEGKIVILKMNLAEYRNISKIIATYLKLDFQSEVMMRLTRKGANTERPVCFISDEYQEYVTKTDSEFFAQSREAKCINIVATQSYTSLLNTLKNADIVKTIIQNLINKIWLRTDDIFTIEQVQKQMGRVLKEKRSKTITENARESKYSYIFNRFKADKSNLSESVNISLDREYLFDFQVFTQELRTFEALYFISDGDKILDPGIVQLQPDFQK